jgi:spore germination protein YaaH
MHTHTSFLASFLIAFAALSVAPLSVHASDDSEVAGWIPYWAKTAGTKSAIQNIDTLDAVYPFVYTVKQDGSLKDNGNIHKGKEWQKLFKVARRNDVEVIPTIMTGERALIESILLDPKKRAHHIDHIVKEVKKGNFDGIDIDYENRSKASVDQFSLFLGELKLALGKEKKLVCTLEPRTPPDSLWKEVPNPLPYSNDYQQIKTYCDVIQIMTYDQQRADLKLNEARAGKPYFPVADTEWVEKVMDETVKGGIPEEKLMLGVATYGRHMGVTVAPNWFQSYAQLGAVNRPDALAIARSARVRPSVTESGEQVVTYLPKTMPKNVAAEIRKMRVPRGTTSGMRVAAQALAYANKTGDTVIINMAWWSDANAIEEKVELAKERDWRGVAMFKIDGEEDPKVWDVLK